MNETIPASASAPPAAQAKRRKSWLRELIETLLLSVAIFLAIHVVVQSYLVEGSSMESTLQPYERVFVNKAAYWRVETDSPLAALATGPDAGRGERWVFNAPARGDVVVFHHPAGFPCREDDATLCPQSEDLIKRVIGMPGDIVEVRGGGVYLNGQRVREPYLDDGVLTETSWDGPSRRWTVPAGHLFVLGDNRTHSSDSRMIGFIPVGNVVGEAMFRYWPLPRIGGIPNGLAVSALP